MRISEHALNKPELSSRLASEHAYVVPYTYDFTTLTYMRLSMHSRNSTWHA